MDDEYCNHPRIEIRKKTYANGSHHYVYQCTRCCDRVGSNAIPHDQIANKAAILPFDISGRERLIKHNAEMRAQRREARREAYHRYLESEKWAEARKKVLRRAGHICEGCLERPATQVHHVSYKHLGAEMCFELRAVCTECHRVIHGQEEEEDAAE
jgi:5-methylcytosine-specific restriction endonuclease McrA